MAISTNQKPTIYRNLYENTGPSLFVLNSKFDPKSYFLSLTDSVYLPVQFWKIIRFAMKTKTQGRRFILWSFWVNIMSVFLETLSR